MKSIQANNKALAQALQEEKLKLRDAQTTILHLRKEYQDLKFQMFALQRNLYFKQAQELVEVFLIVFYNSVKLTIRICTRYSNDIFMNLSVS